MTCALPLQGGVAFPSLALLVIYHRAHPHTDTPTPPAPPPQPSNSPSIDVLAAWPIESNSRRTDTMTSPPTTSTESQRQPASTTTSRPHAASYRGLRLFLLGTFILHMRRVASLPK